MDRQGIRRYVSDGFFSSLICFIQPRPAVKNIGTISFGLTNEPLCLMTGSKYLLLGTSSQERLNLSRYAGSMDKSFIKASLCSDLFFVP